MANFNLNKVIIGGRLTADPELRQTSSGIPVSSFTVAVNRRTSTEGAQQAVFINVIAWRNQAEFLCRFFRKGSSICVVGSIQTRSWTDNQGQKRYATEVVADEVSFGAPAAAQNGGESRPQGQNYTPSAYGAPSFNSTGSADFEEIPGDESLPF